MALRKIVYTAQGSFARDTRVLAAMPKRIGTKLALTARWLSPPRRKQCLRKTPKRGRQTAAIARVLAALSGKTIRPE